jgi:hypothetical protein
VSSLAWIVNTTVMVAFLSTDQVVFSSYNCGGLYVMCVLVVADMGAVNNWKGELKFKITVFLLM